VTGQPVLTVAVPTMNGSRHLAETLRSILAQEQDGVAFDLLVSDDRSEDDTLETTRAVAGDRARLVVNSERIGLADNWNQCVALSRTPLVAVIHQDDVLRPGHLAAHARAFEADPALGLVASASGVIDGHGAEVPESVVGRGGLGTDDRTFAPGEALRLMAAGNPLRCSAVSLRAEAHAEAGGFDPLYRYVVDWEFWCRLAHRWPIAWLARPTVDVRWHPASETHRFKTGTTDLEETERVLDAQLDRLRGQSVDTRPVERAAKHGLSRAYLNRAYVALKGGDAPLGRRCLARSLRLRPAVIRTILADPRLAARLGAAFAAPWSRARRFGGAAPR
jgi:glycosyltransferase involved in cell wall biosynthesis